MDQNPNEVCLLIDVSVGMTKVAVRSTFTAETHGVITTTDAAIVLATTLHEIAESPPDADRSCQTYTGGWIVL